MALSSDTLAVGDPYDNQYGHKAGSVTVFQSDTSGNWTKITRLTPTDAETGIRFGRAITLYCDRLVVGAPFDNSNGLVSGSVHIFTHNLSGPDSWAEIASILGDDSAPGDELGYSASLQGDIAVAGAPGKIPRGSVYVFDLNRPWVSLLPLVSR